MRVDKEVLIFESNLYKLRFANQSDFVELRGILNDQDTMKWLHSFFNKTSWTIKDVRKRYEDFQAQTDLGTSLSLVVERKSDKRILGNCGFKAIDIKNGSAEFGLILHKDCWGTGTAVHCHELVLSHGFSKLELDRVDFYTGVENLRMRGFFDKYGISYLGESLEDGWPHYSVSKAEWPSVQKKLQSKMKQIL